ncbi:MAG: peptidylprolyl isomerase [Clostridia bacterium]|nr:peptidylprolyl isomerase [Clostridia bacterium]
MSEVNAAVNSHKTTDFTETKETTEYVKMSVKDHGDIVIRLRPDVAPETVKNFQELVAKGFYDGLSFHRIMKGFMIQGGDPKGDGTGDAGKDIKGEFTANGFTNNLKHVRGVISMARGNEPDSASCQFFICDAASEHLDNNYASFGYVMAGMETVDSIASVEVQSNGREMSDPVKDVIIEKIVFVKDNHNH